MTDVGNRPRPGVTVARVIRSESLKLAGLRSTWWLLGSALVILLLMTVVWASTEAGEATSESVLGAATPASFSTLILLILLGTITATSEYETRAIVQTFTAVPSRIPVVAAKLAIVFVLSAAVSLTTTFGGFVVADLVEGGGPLLWSPTVVRVLFGVSLFLTCSALIAVSVGMLIHSTIGSVGGVFAFMYLVPTLFALVPVAWLNVLGKTIPGAAASSVYALAPTDGVLDPAVVAVTSVLWALAWIAAAVLVVRRRNA